jgi:DNA-binding NtrC family response regulator
MSGERPSPEAAAPPRPPGVLVADDEAAIRRLLEIALGRQGFTVWSAAGGREAVELFRRNRDAIDLVVLDVQMPGLDGPWTLIALQEIDPQVRCCFMSGHTGGYSAETLQAMGIVRIFQKPFAIAELVEALRALVHPSQ